MKTSTFMNIIALLAIGATLPLGAFAADPTKTVTSQGVTQTKTQKVKLRRLRLRRENITSRNLGWATQTAEFLAQESLESGGRRRTAAEALRVSASDAVRLM